MDSNQIKIQQASAKDIDHLIQLLKQLFAIEKDFVFNEDNHRKGLLLMMEGCGKHKTIKIATHHQTIVGMCTIQTRISTATGTISGIIEDLVVDKNYRGQGIGTALLEQIYFWAYQRGILNLQLLADKNNTPALKFYSRLSWQPTELVCLTQKL